MAALTTSASSCLSLLSKSCVIPSQASMVTSSHDVTLFCNTSSVKLSTTSQPSSYPSVYCGRGDRRTAKGKRFRGSHGNTRPKSSKGVERLGLPPTPLPPRPPKKEETREYIHIDIDERLLMD